MDASTSRSRRSVLALAAAAAGTAAFAGPIGSLAAGAAPRAGVVPLGLQRRDWAPLVGKKVVAATPTGRLRATVVAVEDLTGSPVGDPRSFSIELRSDGASALDGLCAITIPGRGVTTLLVSAVDRGVRHRLSQIVVNNTSS